MKERKGKKQRACLLQKGIAVLLSAALLTVMVSGAAKETRAAGEEVVQGADWTLDPDGTLMILSDSGMTDWIENGSEEDRTGVEHVSIMDGVTAIPDSAFSSCERLRTVDMADSVQIIRDRAFSGCTGLTWIEFSGYLGAIGQEAFFGCTGLTQIEFPDYLETIGQGAFFGCGGLREITLSDMVAGIGDHAFSHCPALAAVYVKGSGSPADLGYQVFEGCRFQTEEAKGIFLDSCTQIPDYQNSWEAYSGYITGSHYNMTKTEAVEATCTQEGNREYYTCSDCGRIYSDDKGVEELTDVGAAAFGHEPEHTWQVSADQHWHICSRCGETLEAALHIEDDGSVTKEPSGQEAGIRTFACRICGYEMRTEQIPPTGAGGGQPASPAGEIRMTTEPGENTPVIRMDTAKEDLAVLCLTEEEKQQLQNGTDVEFILGITDATDGISAADKAAAAAALPDFIPGQYLNILLYKLIRQNRSLVSETAGPVTLVLSLPDSLKASGTNAKRTFAVIRIYNGEAQVLPDLDTREDTVTIATDRFSTYAVVYKDTAVAAQTGAPVSDVDGDKDKDENVDEDEDREADEPEDSRKKSSGGTDRTGDSEPGDPEPDTGDDAQPALYATLTMAAGFSYLLLYFADRRRGMTENKKKELVARLVKWGRQGGRIRRLLAAGMIVLLLVYYHSIGKKTDLEWKEAC